jgi:hypothetical protein
METRIDDLVATSKRAHVPVEDEELMLEEISDDEEDDDLDYNNFEVGDEFDVEPVITATTQPSDENKNIVWCALSV